MSSGLQKLYEVEKLESKELTDKYFSFFDTYIEPVHKENYDKGREMADLYGDITQSYNEAGFIAGFKMAMSLLADVNK